LINFTEKDKTIIFAVRVIPRSSRSEIVGEYDGALKVKLNSPPVDGEANKELITLLAKTFRVSKSDVEIIGGQTSKLKQVKIATIISKDLSAFEQNLNS
jgi:uncharacterized protein